jgi:hypothetical protein
MDKSALTADRVSARTGEVGIEGVGTITVRGLSRYEFITAQKLADDPLKQERYLLSRAMLDPAMNEDDVAAWQKASDPLEINRVAAKVNELSGIKQGADKSNVAAVRD